MSSENAEVGLVDGDDRLHAVRPGISGPTARCGAGRVTGRVPGRFDPALDGACPACSGAVSADG